MGLSEDGGGEERAIIPEGGVGVISAQGAAELFRKLRNWGWHCSREVRSSGIDLVDDTQGFLDERGDERWVSSR